MSGAPSVVPSHPPRSRCRPYSASVSTMFLRHLWGQLVEVARYCRVNEVWWPLPLFVLLLLIGFAAVLGQTVAPYIYTVF